MKLDIKIHNIITDAGKQLNETVCLLDETGEVMLSNDNALVSTTDEYYETIDFDRNIISDDASKRTYAAIDIEDYRPVRLCVYGIGKEIENYMFFLRMLIIEVLKTTKKMSGREQIYKRIMLDRIDPLEVQEAVRDFKINIESERCVIIIQTINGESSVIYNALHKLFRMQEGDMVVSLNRYVIALIKVVDEDSDMESLKELVLALHETINSEFSIDAYLGVGSIKSGLLNIRESFVEAQESINLGLTQQNNSKIFMFHKLLIERFFQAIPRDIRKQFYELAYSDALKKILNDEMLVTVLTFFDNNLNLSEAARKLYIHRNTLIYRLEKIQRLTGLDLRNFDDAVLLKTVIMLGKSLSSNNRME